jgi:hypothetical protein
MRAWRWPALLLVPALAVAAVMVERDRDRDEPVSTIGRALLPATPGPDALSSTWYCAAGTATGADDGAAEHTLHIQNASDEPATGRITVHSPETDPQATAIEVAPRSRSEVVMSEIVEAPFASALVEIDSGEIAVQHEVAGPTGRASGACASTPASQWFFPNGTTRAGTRLVLALFNPFSADAVVDVSFETDDGVRTPQDYQGLVVPAERVVALEVSDVVTLRAELATTVVVRSGRLVAEQLQISEGAEPEEGTGDDGTTDGTTDETAEDGTTDDGTTDDGTTDDGTTDDETTDDETTDDETGVGQEATVGRTDTGYPAGLDLLLGAPTPALEWFFPDGVGAVGYDERFVVFNPGQEPAELEVHVLLDDPEVNAAAEPFELTVAGGRYGVVDTFADGRVPEGVAHAAVVRSVNGVGVVAQRVVLGGDDAAQPGIGSTLGSPVTARRWLVPLGSTPDATAAAVIVLNPSSNRSVTVAVQWLGEGRSEPVGGGEPFELPPGGRRIVDLGADGLGSTRLSLEIESEGAIVVESRFGFEDDADLTYLMAVPVSPTIVVLDGIVGDISDESVVLGG